MMGCGSNDAKGPRLGTAVRVLQARRDRFKAEHPFFFIALMSVTLTPAFYLVVGKNLRSPPSATVLWEMLLLAWWITDRLRRMRG